MNSAESVFSARHRCSFFYWVIGKLAGRKFATFPAHGDSRMVGCLLCGHVEEVTGKEIAAG